MSYIGKRVLDFAGDYLQYGSCILNVILCYSMGYFYFDSSFCVSLVYAAFFFLYIIVVFLTGRRFIPVMYMLYCLGGCRI